MAKQETQATATTPATSGEGNGFDALVSMIAKAGPEAQQAMRNALGVGGAIGQKKPTQSNADARRIAYSVGEVQHPPGFQPKPSEATVAMGPQAVQEWLDRWNERNINPSSKAEEYAAVAVE